MLVCLSSVSSLWGQQVETVIVKEGWSGYRIARQVTGDMKNLSKARVLTAKDEDVTARFINPITGRINEEIFRRRLFVGMKLSFPMDLVTTQIFAPAGNTLREICVEHSQWNCKSLQINNRIPMRKPLTALIRVPKTSSGQKQVYNLPACYTVAYPNTSGFIVQVFPYAGSIELLKISAALLKISHNKKVILPIAIADILFLAALLFLKRHAALNAT